MRSSPADLVLSHAPACVPPAAAASGEPHFFPPSAFPYPRLLPVVVFARSHRSSTRRELGVTLPPALSPRAWVTSSMRRTPSTEAHLDLEHRSCFCSAAEFCQASIYTNTQRRSELPRTPLRRTSENSYSTHSGEEHRMF